MSRVSRASPSSPQPAARSSRKGTARPDRHGDRLDLTGQARQLWDRAIESPVAVAQAALQREGHEGGVGGFLAKVGGVAFELTGVPAVASNVDVALDESKSRGTRARAAAWAAVDIALDLIPLGRVGGIGAKVFRVSGGAKVLQAFKNSTLLGAEVKAGTVIVHHTTEDAAALIGRSGVLRGSERGFLSVSGKGRHLVLTRSGPRFAERNAGQVYAVAADGRTTRAARVIDAVVGVSPETRLGKALSHVSRAKVHGGATVEHTLTGEEARWSRRYGKTIVTRVPPGRTGIALSKDEAARIRAIKGAVVRGHTGPVRLGPVDRAVEFGARHKGAAGWTYAGLEARNHDGSAYQS